MHSNIRVLDLEKARRADSAAPNDHLSSSTALSILNSSPDCIKLIETDGTVSFMNFNGQCAMEIDDFDGIRGQDWCGLWPEASAYMVEQAVSQAKRGVATRFEALCPTAKGNPKWWDVSVSPIKNAEGIVERILSISRDVTTQIEREQKMREHELLSKEFALRQGELVKEKQKLLDNQDTLMREIDHRVKNSLAMISSLLRMQANASESAIAKDELNDAANRVLTISKVHEKLYAGNDISTVQLEDYLEPLCSQIHSAVSDVDVALATLIAPISVSSDRAVALGLIVSELLANSLRHAFPDRRGKIEISCLVGENKQTTVVISDNGIGLPEDFDLAHSTGLGMKIVRLYIAQIGATLKFRNNDSRGARFEFTFGE